MTIRAISASSLLVAAICISGCDKEAMETLEAREQLNTALDDLQADRESVSLTPAGAEGESFPEDMPLDERQIERSYQRVEDIEAAVSKGTGVDKVEGNRIIASLRATAAWRRVRSATAGFADMLTASTVPTQALVDANIAHIDGASLADSVEPAIKVIDDGGEGIIGLNPLREKIKSIQSEVDGFEAKVQEIAGQIAEEEKTVSDSKSEAIELRTASRRASGGEQYELIKEAESKAADSERAEWRIEYLKLAETQAKQELTAAQEHLASLNTLVEQLEADRDALTEQQQATAKALEAIEANKKEALGHAQTTYSEQATAFNERVSAPLAEARKQISEAVEAAEAAVTANQESAIGDRLKLDVLRRLSSEAEINASAAAMLETRAASVDAMASYFEKFGSDSAAMRADATQLNEAAAAHATAAAEAVTKGKELATSLSRNKDIADQVSMFEQRLDGLAE